MDVGTIVGEWLKDHGYDGLYNGDCSCLLDDLMVCGTIYADCQAGDKQPCPGPEKCTLEGCKFTFHVGAPSKENLRTR